LNIYLGFRNTPLKCVDNTGANHSNNVIEFSKKRRGLQQLLKEVNYAT
jgi:hypothetical protein